MGYTAKNIDTEKMLEYIKLTRREAESRHYRLVSIEEARYKQECESLDNFEKCFYCSTYEKNEK